MPNHTTNVVRFSGEPDKIVAVIALLKGCNDFDFNKLIPMPAGLPGKVAVDVSDLPEWYTWSVANWGTKWQAYDHRVPELSADGGQVQYVFLTAWAYPEPIFN